MKALINSIKFNRSYILLLLGGGIISLFVFNIALGTVTIPFEEVIKILTGQEATNVIWSNIIIKTRLPQTITACLAGAGLAVSGLMMQTLFRNPLAGPSILGINSGASLGVAIVMMFMAGGLTGISLHQFEFARNLSVIIAAFGGATLVLFLVLYFARKVQNNAMVLIIGIMVGYITSSLVGVLQYYSFKDNAHSYTMWGLGSFADTTWGQLQVFIPVVVVGLMTSFLLIKTLNTLMLGENYAKNLGLNIKKARLAIIICTGVLSATITAFCGPIAFLGLAVPHITKIFLGKSDHRVLIPAVIFFGAFLALLCNLISRMPGYEGALPINAVTSMFGAPIVISVILKKRRL